MMQILDVNGYCLKNLGKINIILGKNGSGKSILLKEIEKGISIDSRYGKIKYITPERGGTLIYEPNIERSIVSDMKWLTDTRRNNQLSNFRQQSVAQFRNLELLFYREKDSNHLLWNPDNTFANYFNNINKLLDNIEIKPDQTSFKIYKKGAETPINANEISSGESELISLGIECLVFEKECSAEKTNVLLLDEPDVHLHPDLQARLCNFLIDIVSNNNTILIIATHSTAILSALQVYENTHIEFLISGQKELIFKKISDEYRKILPIFGAHPLSNLFNQTPIFLVEGDDDERIWQQAVRSSNRKLKIYPCSTDGISNMSDYERDVEQIISGVYDNARALSLRDRDEGSSTIDHMKIVKRFKLTCRNSENLLLANEVLELLKISWNELQKRIEGWIESNVSHPHISEMQAFKNSNYDRKNFDLKKIRNDLIHIVGSSMAWEVAIGKTIGLLINDDRITFTDENGLFCYLGKPLVDAVLNIET